VIGQRIYPDADGHFVLTAPGQYGRTVDGHWLTSLPVDGELMAGNLDSHEVVEHEDGTITVSPSILTTDYRGREWHGYLERGVWREV